MSERRSDETISRVLGSEKTKIGRLRRACLRVLDEHEERESLPTSVRFVFYELEQAGDVPKTYRHANGARRARQPGQDVSDALTDLREGAIVPWEWIVDEGRTLDEWLYSTSVAEYLRDRVEEARIDLWAGEPPPLHLTESRSLAGVLRPTLSEYLCPVGTVAGQSSGAFVANEVATLLRRNPSRRVIYLGDFDFHGDDIERSARARLEQHVGETLTWERLALTAEQVEAFGLKPIEKIDHRFRPLRRYLAVETEALRQDVIVALVRARLDELLPEPLDRVRVRELAEIEAYLDDGGRSA